MLAHDLPGAASIPMWIIILAVLAGFLFLSLLIFILYKLGFFQRKRPEDYDYQATIQVRWILCIVRGLARVAFFAR